MHTCAPAYSVTDLVREYAETPRQERGYVTMHASSLTTDDPQKKFCGRSYAYAHDLKTSGAVTQALPMHLAVTFSIGYHVQDYVTRAMFPHLVGTWECLKCSLLLDRAPFSPKCPGCGADGNEYFRYHEPRVVSNTTEISGGLDAVVRLANKSVVVEVKSLDKDKFKELKAPFWEHRQRTSLYLRMLEDSDWYGDPLCPVVDHARIIYISKGGYGVKENGVFTPIREYVVERDDALTDTVWAQAKEVSDYRRGLGPMPDRICMEPHESRAGTCPFVSTCFNLRRLR